MRGGGNTARTREWTSHLNSEWQVTCTFYRHIFFQSVSGFNFESCPVGTEWPGSGTVDHFQMMV